MTGSWATSTSFEQQGRMTIVSSALSMHLLNCLSIVWNFLASRGICLAMSPPVKTGSNEHHSNCTLNHSSSVSDVSESCVSLAYQRVHRGDEKKRGRRDEGKRGRREEGKRGRGVNRLFKGV